MCIQRGVALPAFLEDEDIGIQRILVALIADVAFVRFRSADDGGNEFLEVFGFALFQGRDGDNLKHVLHLFSVL